MTTPTIVIANINCTSFVTNQPVVTNVIRSESVSYALDGTMLVDRVGEHKKKISVLVGGMPASQWHRLKTAMEDNLSFNVSFDDGMSGFAGMFHLMSEIPTSYVHFTTGEGDETIVGGIVLEMEEI